MVKKVLLVLGILFVLFNAAVFYHSWHFTHLCQRDARPFVPLDKMGLSAKVGALFTGIYNPKSVDDSLPVAALHAAAQYHIQPDKMILEVPFGSMLQATRNRFNMQHLPAFPLAEMVVFLGQRATRFLGF